MEVISENQAYVNGVQNSCTASPTAETVKLNHRQWMILFCLSFGQFLFGACVSMQAPFFPKEAEIKGATPIEYGFVFSEFELVTIVASPVFGKMIGRCTPKFLVISGQFLTGGCSTLFGFLDKVSAGTPFISLAFAVRFVEGIGNAAFITSCYAIVASDFPIRVATSFSIMATLFGLGLIAGPTIGGLLYEVGGYVTPFTTVGGLLLLAAALSYWFLPDTAPKETKSGNFFALLTDVGIILDALAIISSLMFIGYCATTLQSQLDQFNLSPAITGIIFAITGGVYGATSPIWGWVCDKGFNPKVICIIGYGVQCVNLVFLGPATFLPFQPTLWLVILALLIGGFGMAAKIVCAYTSALKGSQSRGFPDDIVTYGMISAVFSSSCAIGAFIGPSLGGVLLQEVGFRNGTVILLILEIVLAILTTVHYITGKCRSLTPAILLKMSP